MVQKQEKIVRLFFIVAKKILTLSQPLKDAAVLCTHCKERSRKCVHIAHMYSGRPIQKEANLYMFMYIYIFLTILPSDGVTGFLQIQTRVLIANTICVGGGGGGIKCGFTLHS
jgi:hypothetical protein